MPPELSSLMRSARTGQKWSQAYVGRQLGVSGPTYARWELKGEVPKIEQLEQVAALLGIPRAVALKAAGAGIRPDGEQTLYPPLVKFLAALPQETQRELLKSLQDLARAAGGPL